MSKRENGPFRVMCKMWGIETAIKKAKEFGIPVSQEEIDRQRAEEERMKNLWKDGLTSVKGHE